MRSLKTSCFSLFCIVILLSACQNPDPFPPVAKKERALLHVLHAFAPNKIDLKIDQYDQSTKVADGLDFLQAWPASGYASLLVTPGVDSTSSISQLKLQIIDHVTKEELVKVPDFELKSELPTTICIIDSFGKPIVVRTADEYLDDVEAGNAQVRFLNLSPNALSVSMAAKNDSFLIDNFNFLNYSEFKQLPQGVRTFYFINDFTNNKIDSIVNVDIRSRHTYSFFLVNDHNKPVAGYEILDQ
ncbi:MAG: hypothetical protein AB8H47_25650 [Bacteroidia bacterium]